MVEAQDRAVENMKRMQMEQRENMMRAKKEMMTKSAKTEQALARARARENVKWTGSALALVLGGAIAGGVRLGAAPKPLLAAAFPLTFATAYLADLGWGNKLNRIKADAQQELTSQGVDVQIP